MRWVPYLRKCIAYDHEFWYTCVKWWYFFSLNGVFFQFFKILSFWFFRGVKGQKMVQNDKKSVQLCEMIISPGVFFIFSKFWFFRLLVGKRAKKQSKMTKNSGFCTPYLRNHTSYNCHLWYTFVKW